jgi:uncharacterized protein (DUF2147 family)
MGTPHTGYGIRINRSSLDGLGTFTVSMPRTNLSETKKTRTTEKTVEKIVIQLLHASLGCYQSFLINLFNQSFSMLVMKKILLLFILWITASSAVAQTQPNDICGKWLTADKKGIVEIYKRGNFYYGKIIQGNSSSNSDSLDSKNSKPELRSRKVVGMDILKNLKYKAENDWGDGSIYDPNSGDEYNLFISLDGLNMLKLRGFMGISIFGRTEIWTRVAK